MERINSPGDLHSWRLDRDGQMLVSTLFDRGGATAYVRDVSTGERLARRFSGTYSPPFDVADGHVARVHSGGGIYDWQPRARTQTRIAPGAAYVDLRADLVFVPVGKQTYGPRSISGRNAPAWVANFLPIELSPDGQSVLGLNARFPKRRVLLQVRSLSEGTLPDSVDFGDRFAFTPPSFVSAPEQTMRWESDLSFVVQVELPGGSVLVRCQIGGACEHASDIGGNISTAYEYFTWPSGEVAHGNDLGLIEVALDNHRVRTLPDSLTLGPLRVATPVVLAPMAGITNAAYRRLCAEQGAGLYVCEMITSRGLVEGDATTKKMLVFDEAEQVRSVQLYGTDPTYVGRAAQILCEEYGVAHIDLNFGCPVPKVTRKGGGGALPYKRGLLGDILRAAVKAAEPFDVPVTMKTRKGIDEDHLTFLDAGRIAAESGCAAIALHARTVEQAYSGQADWPAIAELVEHVDIPVLGNGDIWEAGDALEMVRQTGASGVVVGRGCLGRPWLFRDLAAAFSGQHAQPELPTLGEVMVMMRRHAELLCEHMGEERGCKEFRKHISWYLKGFRAGGQLRHALGLIDSLATLDDLLAELDPSEPFPVSELGNPRGRQGAPRKRVVLPEGWLDDADGSTLVLREDAAETTGG